MNERIRELAEQAGWGKGQSYDDCVQCSPFCTEEFAKLIVRECMDNLAWHGHDEAVSQLEWFKINKLGIKE